MEKMFLAMGFNTSGALLSGTMKASPSRTVVEEWGAHQIRTGKCAMVGIFVLDSFGRLPNSPVIWDAPSEHPAQAEEKPLVAPHINNGGYPGYVVGK